MNKKGFTYVEILVSITILTVILLGVYNLIIMSLKLTNDNSMKLAATAAANEKMEYIRSLPYSQVGTLTGMLHGVIPNKEIIFRNKAKIYIETMIKYIDDPFDGLISSSTPDLNNNDYKNVRITASYYGPFGTSTIAVYTNVAPRNMESCENNKGTLVINVISANGQPVAGANVHIENHDITPPILDDGLTDSFGYLIYPCASTSVESYAIRVTKNKINVTDPTYSTDYTATRTATNLNPTKPHASVYNDLVTTITFAIDIVSNLNIQTVTASLPSNWQVSDDTSGANQINSRIAVDTAGNVYIVWEDYRSASASKIYAQKYNSSGDAQWPNSASPADQLVTTMNKTIIPDILVDLSGNLYVSWNDNSSGNQDSYLVKLLSSNGSSVWGGEKKINTNADNKDQDYSRISITDNSLMATTSVVWQDNRNTDWDIYAQNFKPNGNKSWANEIRINTDAAGNSQTEPVVVNDSNGNLFIAWTDNRGGDKDIYMAKYASSSAYTNELKVNENNSSTQNQPDISYNTDGSANNFIFVTWTDERNGNQDVYLQKFDLDGNKIWAADKIVSTTTISNQYSPSMAIDNTHGILYILWTDNRNGNLDIYGQKLNLDGDRQWNNDIRINVNNDTSAQYNPDIIIDPSDPNKLPYSTWYSDQAGNMDVFVSKFDSYGSETLVPNVSLVFRGYKQIGDNPIIYKYSSYYPNPTGQFTVNNLEWDTYQITTTSGHQILMSEPALPVNISPNTNSTIKIYVN